MRSLAFRRAQNPNGTILKAILSMAGVHLSGVTRGVLPLGEDEGQPSKGYPSDSWGPPFRGNSRSSAAWGGRGSAIEGIRLGDSVAGSALWHKEFRKSLVLANSHHRWSAER